MTATLPDHAAVVNAMLDGFVQACAVIIASGIAPPDPLMANVRYKLEPPGEEDWKLPNNVIKDGWGDCEDLNGWRAAGLRVTGEDPGARCIVVKTGPGKLHAVVLRSSGDYDDACLELMQLGRADVPQSEVSGLGASKKHHPVTKANVKSRGKSRSTVAQSLKDRDDQIDQQQQQLDQITQQNQQLQQQAAYGGGGGGGGPSMFDGGGGGGDDDLSQMWQDTLDEAFAV